MVSEGMLNRFTMGFTDALFHHSPVDLHLIDSYCNHFCVGASEMAVPVELKGGVFTIFPVCSGLLALYIAQACLCHSFQI